MNHFVQLIDNIIDNYAIRIYITIFFFLHLIHVLVIFNINVLSREILDNLNTLVQMFICFVLFFRFNPWRNVKVNENDKHVIFGSAVFLFSNLAITNYYINYVHDSYYNSPVNITVTKK
jgi:hypothetical protein